jgi:hypothetical protein
MAEFSKQWAEIYDSGFPWDFDIVAEAESIPRGYYKPIICEGFGFSAIEVGLDGKIYLLFNDFDGGLDKVQYESFIQNQKLKSTGI